MALLCMAIESLGTQAESLTGSQAGIVTDTDHGRAKILEVRADRVREALAAHRVPVVAGFQGVSTARDVTTLGRGGSDTTAVALAAALGAEACEIYTDVSGVFTADPRIVPTARRLPRVSFEEMLEMAATGGRVLSLRSVEFARNHGVPLHVRSSFTWEPGTWITEQGAGDARPEEAGPKEAGMEQAIISAVTHDTSEAKVTITGVPDRPGIAARLFRALADRSINVDMIVQNVSVGGHADISFTAPKADLPVSLEVTRAVADELGAGDVTHDAVDRARQPHRRGHEDPSGRGRHHVPDAGRERREHPDDLHLVDPDQLRGAIRCGRAGRRRAPHAVRARPTAGAGERVRRSRRRPLGWAIAAVVLGWVAVTAVQLVLARADATAGRQRGRAGQGDDVTRRHPRRPPPPEPAHGTIALRPGAHGTCRAPSSRPFASCRSSDARCASVDALSNAATQVADTGIEAVTRAREVLDAPHRSGPQRIAVLRRLAVVAERAERDLTGLPLGPSDALIGALAGARDELANEVERTRGGLGRGAAGARAAADLLAGPRRYLILAANNAEMRSGSGMFLSAGVMTTSEGTIDVGDLTSTTDLMLPPGAVPLSGDLADRWGWLHPTQEWRNLGVSPRFDVTGPLAARMWEARGGGAVDGVLALDVAALRATLAAIGPVDVNGRHVDARTTSSSSCCTSSTSSTPRTPTRRRGARSWARSRARSSAPSRSASGASPTWPASWARPPAAATSSPGRTAPTSRTHGARPVWTAPSTPTRCSWASSTAGQQARPLPPGRRRPRCARPGPGPRR